MQASIRRNSPFHATSERRAVLTALVGLLALLALGLSLQAIFRPTYVVGNQYSVNIKDGATIGYWLGTIIATSTYVIANARRPITKLSILLLLVGVVGIVPFEWFYDLADRWHGRILGGFAGMTLVAIIFESVTLLLLRRRARRRSILLGTPASERTFGLLDLLGAVSAVAIFLWLVQGTDVFSAARSVLMTFSPVVLLVVGAFSVYGMLVTFSIRSKYVAAAPVVFISLVGTAFWCTLHITNPNNHPNWTTAQTINLVSMLTAASLVVLLGCVALRRITLFSNSIAATVDSQPPSTGAETSGALQP